MNNIFGIWRPCGDGVTEADLRSLAGHTAHFESDGEYLCPGSEVGMGIQAGLTHIRSTRERQPESDKTGNLLVYDGRLDNYRDLLKTLDIVDGDLSDPEIVLNAYRRYGSDCFSRLIGDWALVLWDGKQRTLYLARDHAGTRTLHYSRDGRGNVMWSTCLDSFIDTPLLATPDDTYVAAYLAMLPNYARTPYRDVRAVLPGHFLKITSSGIMVRQFWTALVYERLSYGSESDYDAHFLQLLEQSVARRTGQGCPIVAHLSGGMDSTSIVCVSDKLRRSEGSSPQLLDTLSIFNDSDPNWNERPYFTLVEKYRGKTGFHMDASRYRNTFEKHEGDGAEYLYPGTDASNIQWDRDLFDMTKSRRHRVIISGIGGDELTGGVPDVIPELADHIVRGRMVAATRLAVAWSLSARISLAEATLRTASFFVDHLSAAPKDRSWQSIPWLTDRARQLCDQSVAELPLVAYQPLKMPPSAAANCRSWWFTLRNQPHLRPSEVYRFEYRYPYLDRDLVDFLLRVPPGQLVKPGRRRAMMRRTLVGIVPDEILERRRKAFLLKSSIDQVILLASRFEQIVDNSVLQDLGFIVVDRLKEALQDTVSGKDLRFWPQIIRTMAVETWLRRRFRWRTSPTSKISPASDTEGSYVSADQVPL
jgi:asparagine synthase (glutamine-hydrolysing)